MVIRGGTRGNGKQLAQYLTSGEANERVQIVEVAGRLNAKADYLHQTLQSMSLTSELTKSQKGLYHAQINPAYSEDRKMSQKDWLKAADILGKELGLQEQRRVIVLHTKKGRTHAHVVWERYDHKRGKVISDSFSRLAQDRARKEMERVFEHTPTPHRNQHRPELKEALTNLWNQTKTGRDFVKAVHDNGYLLAEGVPRYPFMVVDENGRSFDLVRQLKGVRIKEVRQRLRHEKLIPEKEAIELMRQKQEGSSEASHAGQQCDQEKAKRTASVFWDNKLETTVESTEAQSRKRMEDMAESFLDSSQDMTKPTEESNGLEKKKIRAGEYFNNADELTGKVEQNTTDENEPQSVENETEIKQDISAEPQSDESRQRQQRVAEEFSISREDTSQPSLSPEKKRQREKLKEFMHSEDELVEQVQPTKEGANIQRQQTNAKHFFENEVMTSQETPEDESEIQRLMQEQRAIRERNQQKVKKQAR
ncbi:relaxase/mobilization nuclease domain-containing protein [Spirosoma sp. BT702]|uniref:Relaxase/mobilization nuclease domain-containing protein n=1 Tax=Spirosoma profusum TaxID=2771354 RepID=A0A927AUT6_9BACT|nr:relaxase/mobilization nuclease domain-containing protein [Spirosoma profusum]MBD2704809.1 relaxase/mobilization nuclease domain-containing protein [Spirosoma profusum]